MEAWSSGWSGFIEDEVPQGGVDDVVKLLGCLCLNCGETGGLPYDFSSRSDFSVDAIEEDELPIGEVEDVVTVRSQDVGTERAS